MQYFFIDESGDLGFGAKSSRYFLCTCIITENKRSLEKVLAKARKALKKKWKRLSEFHAYHMDPQARKLVLKNLSKVTDLRILVYLFSKEKISHRLQGDKHDLYRRIIALMIEKPIKEAPGELFVDQRETNKLLNQKLEEVVYQVLAKKSSGHMKVFIKPSYEVKGLQVADIISWAIFRKYEYGDDTYYKMIENLIIWEHALFLK
jgi:hypothetical protein